MRKLAITLAVLTTLAVAATASAVVPSRGAFAGTTGLRPINGFSDLVTFKSASNKLTKFQFGTLGCFGTGAFPIGVDPYGDPGALATLKTIPVTAKGTFTFTTKTPLTGSTGVVTTSTVTGTFTAPGKVSGLISISQSENGDTCASKMKFTAVPGTPDSLGLNG
jgi:hypothetical protein